MNLGQENEYQEFKESLTQLDKGLKSLTAILNKNNMKATYHPVLGGYHLTAFMISMEVI